LSSKTSSETNIKGKRDKCSCLLWS